MSKNMYILDGGLGSDLFINGGFDKEKINNDPLWLARVTYEDPDAIKACHKRFLEAGCDVISTASYQASVDGYVQHAGVTREKAEEIIGSSVDIARQAIKESAPDRDVVVAGSISPYGAILHDMSEYSGSYIDSISEEVLTNFHKTNIRILASKGVDIFAFETLPALKEALVLIDILREYPNQKAWVSFTTQNGTHTSYGDPFTKVFQELSKFSQVLAIGTNCCEAKYTHLVLQAAKETMADHQKCIIYPDNRNCDETKVPSSPLCWLPDIRKWLDTGLVEWIGGCCLTTPSHIRQIKDTFQDWKVSK